MALNTTLSPTPSLPTPRAALPEAGPAASLEERIQAAEARLVQREQDLALRWHQLQRRVRLALSPRRWIKPVAIGAVSLLGLWWLLRRAVPATRPERRPQPDRSHQGAPFSPATAAAAMTLGLPLAERLFGGEGAHDASAPLQTMPRVDLQRYAGTWYEIARLPTAFESGCEGQPSAHYEALAGGGLRVINRCRAADGSVHEVEGVASVLPESGNARLELSLWPQWLRWLPLAWAPYWIVFVDTDYEVAVVGDPNRRFLWLLSRQPQLAPAQLDTLVRIAHSQGYPVERLRFVQ
jgi:apolipoprotein D and lipocalin family protein